MTGAQAVSLSNGSLGEKWHMDTYALVNAERTEIIKTGPRPTWFDDGRPVSNEVLRYGGFEIDETGRPLTDEHGRKVLASGKEGWYPIVFTTEAHDPTLQRLVQKPRSEWLIESKRVVVTYDVVDIDIEELRQTKIQEATDMRWQVMTGGMTLPNGVQVGTDIDDQNRITSVVANAELAGLTDADEVDFKAASGWVRISIAEVKQIAGAIGQHVQACYSAERAHHEAIEAIETREEVAAYDVGVGWPETQPETEPT